MFAEITILLLFFVFKYIYKLNLGELNRDSEQGNKTEGKSRADSNTSKKNLPLSTEMNRNVTHGAKQIIGELNRQPTKNPPRKAFTWQEIVDRSRRKGETKVCDYQNIFHTQRSPQPQPKSTAGVTAPGPARSVPRTTERPGATESVSGSRGCVSKHDVITDTIKICCKT